MKQVEEEMIWGEVKKIVYRSWHWEVSEMLNPISKGRTSKESTWTHKDTASGGGVLVYRWPIYQTPWKSGWLWKKEWGKTSHFKKGQHFHRPYMTQMICKPIKKKSTLFANPILIFSTTVQRIGGRSKGCQPSHLNEPKKGWKIVTIWKTKWHCCQITVEHGVEDRETDWAKHMNYL